MKLATRRTFRHFWSHAMRYKALTAVLTLSMVITVLVELVPPYFGKRFFDTLSGGGAPAELAPRLVTLILMIAAVEGVAWVFWRIFNFCNSFFQSRIMANIANECFEYLHGHSTDFFNSHFSGALVKKVNRLVRAFEGIADQIFYSAIPLALRVAAIFGILFWLQPLIGLVMLVWTFLFLSFNYAFSVYKLRYDVSRAEADSRISGALADTITNNVNIKLFSALKDELTRFKAVTEDWFKKTRKAWDLGQIAEAIQTFLMIALEFLIFYFAIGFFVKGELTIGDFFWIQAYLINLFGKLWDFGRVIRNFYEYLADSEEMIEVLHTPHAIQDRPRARCLHVRHGRIEFKSVCFTYASDAEVIHGFHLSIKPGEKVALIGPSGGGKSTIIKILLRLFDVKKGQILIDGQEIRGVTQSSLRSQIAFVPQDPILFHRSLMENIRYGRRGASDEEVMAAAKLARCHEFITKFPHGYDTLVGERGVKLSGGERQRVAIARAILCNAPILILDEATSSLDSESEKLIQEALENLMKQKTTLVVAHRLSTIMRMDRIVVLQGGQIAEEGTHTDLVSQQSGLYKKLWDLQVGGYVDK